MPDDPIGTPARTDPEPSKPAKRKNVECGFCGCTVDADGEIISMGKRAKEFRAQAENDETRIAQIDRLESEVADLKKKLEAKKESPVGEPATEPTTKKPFFAIQ